MVCTSAHDDTEGHVEIFNPSGSYMTFVVHDGSHYDPLVIRGSSWEIRRFPPDSINININIRLEKAPERGHILLADEIEGPAVNICKWALCEAVLRKKKRLQCANSCEIDVCPICKVPYSQLLKVVNEEAKGDHVLVCTVGNDNDESVGSKTSTLSSATSSSSSSGCEFPDPVPLSEVFATDMVLSTEHLDDKEEVSTRKEHGWIPLYAPSVTTTTTTVTKTYHTGSYEYILEQDNAIPRPVPRLTKVSNDRKRKRIHNGTLLERTGSCGKGMTGVALSDSTQVMVVPYTHDCRDYEEDMVISLFS